MKARTLFAAVGVLVCIVTANVKAELPEMTCKEFVASLTKRQLTGISTCTKAMKFKNAKEKASKMNCILKCVLIKESVLDKEGFFNEAAFNGFVDSELPPNLREIARPMMQKCVEQSTGLDPKEEMCKTYDPFIKCLLGFIGELCKVA